MTLEKPLQMLIGRKLPGDKVKLKIWRNGETLEKEVTLEEAP